MTHGTRLTEHGTRRMAHGVWRAAHNAQRMSYGAPLTEHSARRRREVHGAGRTGASFTWSALPDGRAREGRDYRRGVVEALWPNGSGVGPEIQRSRFNSQWRLQWGGCFRELSRRTRKSGNLACTLGDPAAAVGHPVGALGNKAAALPVGGCQAKQPSCTAFFTTPCAAASGPPQRSHTRALGPGCWKVSGGLGQGRSHASVAYLQNSQTARHANQADCRTPRERRHEQILRM